MGCRQERCEAREELLMWSVVRQICKKVQKDLLIA